MPPTRRRWDMLATSWCGGRSTPAPNTGWAARAGPPPAIVETQYQHPIGWVTPPQWYAMFARSHMSRWGTTSEDLGRIAVQQRANAVYNERAMMRAPMTMDDYLASRWIVEPFRLFDCCLETDAAAAVVITTAERARDLRQPPVLISGMTWGGGHMMHSNRVQADWTTSVAEKMARRLYAMAGVGPNDVAYASLYDAFTHLVLVQVEDYGFAPKGEAAAFIAEGGTAPGGRIPVNTHGGFSVGGLCPRPQQPARGRSPGSGHRRALPGARRRGGPVHRPARLCGRQLLGHHPAPR